MGDIALPMPGGGDDALCYRSRLADFGDIFKVGSFRESKFDDGEGDVFAGW